MNAFLKALSEDQPFLGDGATGTNLFAMGLQSGDAPEPWNLDHPDRILALHEGFVNAGSRMILTNSFGGNRYRMKLHNFEDRAFELNKAAAELARQAGSRAKQDVIVAGSMGPTGEILAPLGALSFDDAVEAFREQAEGLKAGGADVLCFETLSAPDELRAGVQGAKTTGLPVIATMSFDTAGRTMMGLTPADAMQLAIELELDAFGANCGTGAPDLLATVEQFARVEGALPIIAKANCGIPEYVDGQIVYSGTVTQMGDYTQLAASAGAKVIGGCCGTTATHIAVMSYALNKWNGERTHLTEDSIQPVVGDMSDGAKALLSGNDNAAAGRPARRNRRRG